MAQQPQPVYTAAPTPTRQIGTGALPTAAPTNGSINQALLTAHGKVGESSLVTVEVSAAATITFWVYSPASQRWINPGYTGTKYTLVFAAGDLSDFFQAEPGTLFYLQSSAGSVNAYTNAPKAKPDP